MELAHGMLLAACTVPTAHQVIAETTGAVTSMFAANDGVASASHVCAIAITLGLRLGTNWAEVARSPETLGTDVLLAGAAVGLEMDDEGSGAVRAGHFGRRHL